MSVICPFTEMETARHTEVENVYGEEMVTKYECIGHCQKELVTA